MVARGQQEHHLGQQIGGVEVGAVRRLRLQNKRDKVASWLRSALGDDSVDLVYHPQRVADRRAASIDEDAGVERGREPSGSRADHRPVEVVDAEHRADRLDRNVDAQLSDEVHLVSRGELIRYRLRATPSGGSTPSPMASW
jgi:hypothetical protein